MGRVGALAGPPSLRFRVARTGFAPGRVGKIGPMSSHSDDPGRVEQTAAPGPVKAGKDGRTLFIALGGTMLLIAIAFVIALCLVVTAYLVAR